MMNRALFSSKNQDWTTPDDTYIALDNEFHFNYDPCPNNPMRDGLKEEWKERNFVNPPYNKIKDWIKKGYEEWKKGKLVVFLIPARTDTKWFHEYIYHQAEIRFIKGRLKFGRSENSAPFPSMIVIFRPRYTKEEQDEFIQSCVSILNKNSVE